MKQKKLNFIYLLSLFLSILLILNMVFKPKFILFGLLHLEKFGLIINLLLILFILFSIYNFFIKNRKYLFLSKFIFLFLFFNSIVNILFIIFYPIEINNFLINLYQNEDILIAFLINQILLLLTSFIIMIIIYSKRID